eukprot:3619055-Prymnesium_polylepis.3
MLGGRGRQTTGIGQCEQWAMGSVRRAMGCEGGQYRSLCSQLLVHDDAARVVTPQHLQVLGGGVELGAPCSLTGRAVVPDVHGDDWTRCARSQPHSPAKHTR